MRKGIATETIFYIVIGIVVVGLLSTLVISYTNQTRESSDCRVANQQYCEQWETSGTQPTTEQWNTMNGRCENTAPTQAQCNRLGFDIQ